MYGSHFLFQIWSPKFGFRVPLALVLETLHASFAPFSALIDDTLVHFTTVNKVVEIRRYDAADLFNKNVNKYLQANKT
jgi:hypothetical protein